MMRELLTFNQVVTQYYREDESFYYKFQKYTDTRGMADTGLASIEMDGNASMVHCIGNLFEHSEI